VKDTEKRVDDEAPEAAVEELLERAGARTGAAT